MKSSNHWYTPTTTHEQSYMYDRVGVFKSHKLREGGKGIDLLEEGKKFNYRYIGG